MMAHCPSLSSVATQVDRAVLARCSTTAPALVPCRCAPFSGRRLSSKALTTRPSLSAARGHSRRWQVRASWGAPVEWAAAKVTNNEPAATQLHRIQLDIGERAAGYEVPGQYIQVRVGESKPGFFAIASPPDVNNAGVIELLVKDAGETAELLCDAAAGADVEVSPVQGKGFQLDKVAPPAITKLLLFATGSGISPIRAAIESGKLQSEARDSVTLYYGTHDADAMAYRDELAGWESAGVSCVPVYSVDGKGYVQDVLAANGAPSNGDKVGVLLCGHKDMCVNVTDILTAAGVDKEHILLNF